jgi:signal transduction histidine kinase/FixJ family two-component response regulator
MKNLFLKIKAIFEAYGDESSRETFRGDLNYEAGKLCFAVAIAMVVWLPYIPNDLKLHQFPLFAVCVRLGLTLVSAFLIALKFATKRFRNRPDLMMLIMLGYVYFGASIIAATAGEYVGSYMGGYCFILMLCSFAPFALKYKASYIALSYVTFLMVGTFFGLDYEKTHIQYSLSDLTCSTFIAMWLSIIFHNVKYTSWERRMKLKMASKAKGNFLANMSHEIRTPMNAITGMAELALREDMAPKVREHVSTIKQASTNLLSIINDILDFSKIESGKLEIIPVNYYISSLANDVANIVRMKILDSGVQFTVDIDGKIPNVLYGDEVRIRQVLLNILGNAVKFTKKGSISFTINGKIISDDKISLIISITDTGKGIKEEDIKKLFSDFVQVDTTANKGIEGTGLGLSITKSLVKAMGGDIDVASKYGEGSTFTITLPQEIRSNEPVADLNLNEINTDKKLVIRFNAPNAKILVVDDVQTNLKVAEGLLAPYRMQLDLCQSGAEAIEAVKSNNYDLVFMDHMMPEMDGIEATKYIREFSDVPVIAFTANAISGTREMFMENSFNDFLSKPIDVIKLNAVLEKWIPKEKQEKPEKNESNSNQKNTQLLSAFHKDGTQIIKEIKKSLETGNYLQYTIYVHGLKSASANVGANELSALAKALEDAGRRGDISFIKEHNDNFISSLQTHLDNIEKVLSANKKESTDTEALKAELIKLKEAINAFDLGVIDEATNVLQNFVQAESILQSTLIGEHDKAIAAIDALLKEIK